MGYSIDPQNNNWINMSILVHRKNQYNKFDIYENLFQDPFYKLVYQEQDNIPKNVKNILGTDTITSYKEKGYKYIQYSEDIMEIMVTMNYENKMFHYVIPNESIDMSVVIPIPLIESKVRFICIEYYHPHMTNDPLLLKIPLNSFYVGNNILGSLFIKRLLENQYESYIFDDEYYLDVIDMNFTNIRLQFGEFLLLDSIGYTICR
jgi:hypothetical protein